MARRKKESFSYTRDIGVDERYGSPFVQKWINVVMWRGKKNVARKIVYDAMEALLKKAGGDKEKALDMMQRAFEQVTPVIEVRSRRVGGSVYQIPREVRSDRAHSLGMRWLIQAAASRPGKTMGARMAHELLDALEGRGNAVKKKTDVHKMAEANKAFAHYAW